jgi:GH24 family phage-related lysozyme (muramidase)
MTRIAAATGSSPPSIDDATAIAADRGALANATGIASAKQTTNTPVEATPDRPALQPMAARQAGVADARTFLPALIGLEGESRHMYLDTAGLVTTGIGHMLKTPDAAVKLPWYHETTGLPATPSEVRTRFEELRASWAHHRTEHPKEQNRFDAKSYEKGSDLVLPPTFPRKDAIDRLQNDFLPKLRKVFPGFDAYPMPAQRAIVDMAYNLGIGKLEKGFPNFVGLCRDGKFAQAAVESHRSSSREERNVATRQLLEEADRLKTSVGSLAVGIRS